MSAFATLSSSHHAVVTPQVSYALENGARTLSPLPFRGTFPPRIAEPNAPSRCPQYPPSQPQLSELGLRLDTQRATLWQYMQPKARPSFTTGLLADMNLALDWVWEISHGLAPEQLPVRYLVLASRLPGTFNLGGDLALFMRAIETRDDDVLRRYAEACIHVQYRRCTNLMLPIGTIALVQGDALGGGFEAALAHEVIIAERQAKFGLPEVLFNLFPGMGALSFLSRRLPLSQAERIILSGRVYSAEEMLALGIVDRVVDEGRGEEAVIEFTREADRSWRSRQAVAAARRIVNPVTENELLRIVDLWVETAMTLSPADLRKMKHLICAQDRRWSKLQANC
jgi:DSF synthase